jgi:hypothetical protein
MNLGIVGDELGIKYDTFGASPHENLFFWREILEDDIIYTKVLIVILIISELFYLSSVIGARSSFLSLNTKSLILKSVIFLLILFAGILIAWDVFFVFKMLERVNQAEIEDLLKNTSCHDVLLLRRVPLSLLLFFFLHVFFLFFEIKKPQKIRANDDKNLSGKCKSSTNGN